MSLKGKRVSFKWETAPGVYEHGTGEVLTEEDDKGRVQVACDPVFPEARHFVILCTVTWLTPIPTTLPAPAP